MAGYRPARGGLLETMADFYDRRTREVAELGREADRIRKLDGIEPVAVGHR